MSNKVQTSLRIDEDKLREAKQILGDLGLNYSEAVNIFTSMVVSRRGLPFDVALPSEETVVAMNEVRADKNVEGLEMETLKDDLKIQ